MKVDIWIEKIQACVFCDIKKTLNCRYFDRRKQTSVHILIEETIENRYFDRKMLGCIFFDRK